eukprot:jgi/Psemu1/291269/fgenesh1_pg.662_\
MIGRKITEYCACTLGRENSRVSTKITEREQRWARRLRLLHASRGLRSNRDVLDAGPQPSSKKRPLPAFPLEARHFGGYDHQFLQNSETRGSLPPNTPQEFHETLCGMIRNAKRRVRIASLYIGPATSNKDDCEEAELLEALSEIVNRNHRIEESNDESRRVSVKILLDENRALRPVPIIHSTDSDKDDSKTTTSSAEAVARAIHGNVSIGNGKSSSSSLHLFRVLPPTTIVGKNWLPNPVDEIAGVFHIKIYIVDDQLLLSGANLSREYFRDRMDRYLHLVDGANGLVDFYAELVEILCRHSNEYQLTTATTQPRTTGVSENTVRQNRNSNLEFLREITEHFRDGNKDSASLASAEDLFAMRQGGHKTVAVGVPTFQAPVGYFRHNGRNGNDNNVYDKKPTPVSIAVDFRAAWSTFWSLFRINQQLPDEVDFVTDVEATLNLLTEAGKSNNKKNDDGKSSSNRHYSVQMSSAYLNPTRSLLSVLKNGFHTIELLTAGKISHGFKPKKKDCNEGSQGKDWTIPSVFDRLVDECMGFLRSTTIDSGTDLRPVSGTDARLFYWERHDWTFHAKGIWMTEEDHKIGSGSIKDDATSEVAAAVIGSSNFGYRSFCRDMESNLLIVFPPATAFSENGDDTARIAHSFGDEWKGLLDSSKPEAVGTGEDPSTKQSEEAAEKPPPLPWPILKSIPYVKSFF